MRSSYEVFTVLGKTTTPNTHFTHSLSWKQLFLGSHRPMLPAWASRQLCDFGQTARPLIFSFPVSKMGRVIPTSEVTRVTF